MTIFIGVCKAIYAYEPQTPEELKIDEDDFLYLLEKSDIDEWWTVKKRVLGTDAEEPQGLVPSNYVESAPVISVVKSLYDYQEAQNPDEELTFVEDEVFDVFDDRDQDWLLVRSHTTNQYGFVPGNYIEPANSNTLVSIPPPAAVQEPTPQMHIQEQQHNVPAPILPAVVPQDHQTPPPMPAKPPRPDEAPLPPTPGFDDDAPPLPMKPPRPMSTEPEEQMTSRDRARSRAAHHDIPPQEPARPPRPTASDHDLPPPEPARPPRPTHGDLSPPPRSHPQENYNPSPPPRSHPNNTHDDGLLSGANEGAYQTWNVAEVEGHSKIRVKLSIGRNKIFLTPEKGLEQEWTIDKLISFNSEKKHMFLEFVDPFRSLEIHTGDTETCNDIIHCIGEIKGASRDRGLLEVKAASESRPSNDLERKKSRSDRDRYGSRQRSKSIKKDSFDDDFDEDNTYYSNDVTSPSKKSGLSKLGASIKKPFSSLKKKHSTPAVETNSSSKHASSSSTYGSSSYGRSASGAKDSSNHHSSSDKNNGSWKDDVDQNSSNRKRRTSVSAKKEFPDSKKTRIWADKTNTFKVDAQFIGCKDGKIHLHKANGVKIAVPANKLSTEDLIFVERLTGFSLDKYKSPEDRADAKNHDANERRDDDRERQREEDRRRDEARNRRREQEKERRDEEERERDRRIRNKEVDELRRAREALDDERQRLKQQATGHDNNQRSRDLSSNMASGNSKFDWFDFFLDCSIDIGSVQRYTNNFEKEHIGENMMPDINPSMLRSLGLREGDIVRVMKFLDKKFGRETSPPPNNNNSQSGMFTEPNGALKINGNQQRSDVSQNLLPNQRKDDDTWTTRPASGVETRQPDDRHAFTGTMQDLLDVQPLESTKQAVSNSNSGTPEPNLKELKPVRTGNSIKQESIKPVSQPEAQPVAPPAPQPKPDNTPVEAKAPSPAPASEGPAQPSLQPVVTGGASNLVPLNPFKTGSNNILPASTTFVLLPFATGGAVLPQITGAAVMPQTSFGAQMTGGALPLQITGGILPTNITGGTLPQTTFGQLTGGALPLQRTGGAPVTSFATNTTALPTTTFGTQQTKTILPVQKTANGLIPLQRTGGLVPNQITGGLLPQTTFGTQVTGGGMPMSTFATQMTGGAVPLPQTSFGTQVPGGAISLPQTSFGAQLTGGAMQLPQTSFGTQMAGGAMQLPQTSFAQMTGGAMQMNQFTGGAMPMNQLTGGAMPMNQLTGGAMQMNQLTGGAMQMNQLTGGAMQMPSNTFNQQPQTSFVGQTVGGFQPKSQFGLNLQRTGGLVNGVTTTVTTTSTYQNNGMSQPLQTQPTGMGFGNAPQTDQNANVQNASVNNPFGL